MHNTKKVLAGLIIILAVIQLFQPARNNSGQILTTDITKVVNVPPDVLLILKRSCYDCHSNQTMYPWYSWIQPGAWFMNSHIKEGKSELNFSDFGSYSLRRQNNKLKAISNIIPKDEMPLASYAILHPDAKLSGSEKAILIRWADSLLNKDY